MAEKVPQTYATHRRFDPPYHIFVFGVLVIHVIVRIVQFVKSSWSLGAGWEIVVAAALVVLFFRVRIYALRVQDRVIRLEEQLRLQRILPESLRSRIPELKPRQLVGLRFAADGEVAGLVEKALAGLDGEAIKKEIQSWRPDTFRV